MAAKLENVTPWKVPKKAVAFGIVLMLFVISSFGIDIITDQPQPPKYVPGSTRGLASEPTRLLPMPAAVPETVSLTLATALSVGSLFVGILLAFIGLMIFKAIREREDKWVTERAGHDEKVAADIQGIKLSMVEMKGQILDGIREEFKGYVDIETFKAYMEAHSREDGLRTKEVTEFMVRHRDFKHGMEPWRRGVDMQLEDIKKRLDEK